MENFIYLIWKKWTWQARLTFAAALFGLVLLLFLISGVQSCRREKAKLKDEENKTEMLKTKGKIELLEEKEKEVKKDEKQANENARRAESNFNSIIGTDSNSYDGNFSTVRRKFCQQPEFANDSRCR